MTHPQYALEGTWPDVPFDDWETDVRADGGDEALRRLRTPLGDGLHWEPLYTADRPGAAAPRPALALSRPPGQPWDIACGITAHLPEEVAARIVFARDLGASVFRIRLDDTLRRGRDPDAGGRAAADGVVAGTVADWRAICDAAGPDTTLAIDAGLATPVAIALADAARGENGPRLVADADPVTSSVCLPEGWPPPDAERCTLSLLQSPLDTVATLRVDLLQERGASAPQAIAAGLGLLTDFLRQAEAFGVSPSEAAQRVAIRVAVGRDVLHEVAFLRALHVCWARVLEAIGVEPALRSPHLHAVTALRTRSERDPWVNLLRNTGDTFAAAVGGARSIDALPADALRVERSLRLLRMAINAQRVLREESHLALVGDPAAGSWALEGLTEALADRAWERFQEVEAAGGIQSALGPGGVLRTAMAASAAERLARVASGRQAITGVNAFPDADERPLPDPDVVTVPTPGSLHTRLRQWRADHPPAACLAAADCTEHAGRVRCAAAGATHETLCTALARAAVSSELGPPIAAVRDAAAFETLRDAADRHATRTGSAPTVRLVGLGTLAEHRARALFSRTFFTAGGFSVLEGPPVEDARAVPSSWQAAPAPVAVLCGSDSAYAALAADAARALKETGASAVVLAGRPGEHAEAWASAGVDGFIHLGCPMVETLTRWQDHQGVNR